MVSQMTLCQLTWSEQYRRLPPHELTHEKIINSPAASSTEFEKHMRNAYIQQITRSRLSGDITFTISLITIFVLFKTYITNLIILRDEVAQLRVELQNGIGNRQDIICDDTSSTSTITI